MRFLNGLFVKIIFFLVVIAVCEPLAVADPNQLVDLFLLLNVCVLFYSGAPQRRRQVTSSLSPPPDCSVPAQC